MVVCEGRRNYADPAMKMAILESGDIEASEEKAEQSEASSSNAKRHGDVLVAEQGLQP